MGRKTFALLAGVVAAGLVAAAGAGINSKRASDTLVFAGSADPALLDPSLISD